MIGPGELSRLEAIIDASGAPGRIEALLPVGVRPRQLSVRTLLLGMLIVAVQARPAHLRRVHRALICLPEADKRRLGVIAPFKSGPHLLSYRQLEYTFARVVAALSKKEGDGEPSQILSEVLDALLEGSVRVLGPCDSDSYALDWTDLESWARAPRKDGRCADREASWGHRNVNTPAKAQSFFGYYLQAATSVCEEQGPEVPELVRRITLASAKHDPPAQIVAVIERMANEGIALGDLIAERGYSYRAPQSFAMPMRRAGAKLVMDIHPNDRGCKGTHGGAIIANGNLYCPVTPKALFELSALPPGASEQDAQEHERRCRELHRHKLSPITSPDGDGYHRVICPAAAGKLRCPLRAQSMSLSHERPTVLQAPEHPPACCRQKTITTPPTVNAKTAQKHDWPSASHRASYDRRSAAERTFASVKDPAANNLARGWCRLMGLAPIALFAATVFIARNLRIADAFTARRAEDQRRQACGAPPRRRRRRRAAVRELTSNAKANAPPV